MNKIFKTKYDVTTGQAKVVSELANNRQLARIRSDLVEIH
ncbi:ESPR-type extended signal peptide-containing protein [Histophilus somni]|nr:ESPR-type extended signal peptide-containing protein [Histophilus somni]QQF78447.1 ESPR domain-containing protein [Histophilus somni]